MSKVELHVIMGFIYINQHANRSADLRAVFGLLDYMIVCRRHRNRF